MHGKHRFSIFLDGAVNEVQNKSPGIFFVHPEDNCCSAEHQGPCKCCKENIHIKQLNKQRYKTKAVGRKTATPIFVGWFCRCFSTFFGNLRKHEITIVCLMWMGTFLTVNHEKINISFAFMRWINDTWLTACSDIRLSWKKMTALSFQNIYLSMSQRLKTWPKTTTEMVGP